MSIIVHITTPWMPIVSDSKRPSLGTFRDEIKKVVEAAARSSKSKNPVQKGQKITIKSVVTDNLEKAIEVASGGGRHRYSVRQLFYQIRPILLALGFAEPSYSTFSDIITDIENELGEDLPGIYRDIRGTLYHPHLHKEIPIGTSPAAARRHGLDPEWV